MRVKQTIQKLALRLEHLSVRTKIIIGVGFIFLSGYSLIFAFPKPVDFAYSGQDCTRQLTLMPAIVKQVSNSGFVAHFEDTFMVGSLPLASFKTCFSASQEPRVGETKVRVSPLGGIFAMKTFAIEVAEPPVASTSDFIDKMVPVSRPLAIKLTGADEVFSYKFMVGETAADCDHRDAHVYCDIESLGLAQGETYTASLARYFKGNQVEVLGEGRIETLRALVLVNSSVTEGQTIYDKPASYTFEYDKPLESAAGELKIKEGEEWKGVDATVTVDGTKAIVTPAAELKRNAAYELTLTKAEAPDGSALPSPYKVGFTMSSGPKVTGINIDSTGVSQSGSIILTFDQEIANFDILAKTVVTDGLDTNVSGSGNRIVINYEAGTCDDFSITVKKGFESAVGVAQEDEWNFTGRIICHTVRTIGYSQRGRAINAFSFGSGSNVILYTGSIHGNEHSAGFLMNAWIDELDANARSIPAGTRIVVIPSVNPDGTAANSRYNSNGVDLNRNYNTSDWQQDTQTVDGDPVPGGGGGSPGSERETQVLMAYTNELRPRLTMSYHSSAAYAIGNQCGDSASLAATYARLTGYSNMTGVSGAFGYQITGTYDDWMCERLGLTSVLIELATSYSAEFGRNKAALWAMARS